MILLIGNYPHDAQESMQRFAQMLLDGLREAGETAALLVPQPFFGKLNKSGSGLGKWLGYLDKFLLFPIQLRRQVAAIRQAQSPKRPSIMVHICDHSNAMYAPVARRVGCPVVITCHDLGAVRGALGEATWCPASRTGKILQQWILRSLGAASRIVCDSTATQADVVRLLGSKCPPTRVALLGLNQALAERTNQETSDRLAAAFSPREVPSRFLLQVGSSLPRKNRDGVLRIFDRIKDQWDGKLVFAGAPLSDELHATMESLGLAERVIVMERPTSAVLEALYNQAFALLFPSRFEGFGWPIIEAQACGCPVLCSDAASLPEVAGEGALIRPVEDEAGFAADLLSLMDNQRRADLIQRGRENLQRFDRGRMLEQYLTTYRELAAAAA